MPVTRVVALAAMQVACSLSFTYSKYITVESREYAPPLLHASIGQKWGGGLYAGS